MNDFVIKLGQAAAHSYLEKTSAPKGPPVKGMWSRIFGKPLSPMTSMRMLPIPPKRGAPISPKTQEIRDWQAANPGKKLGGPGATLSPRKDPPRPSPIPLKKIPIHMRRQSVAPNMQDIRDWKAKNPGMSMKHPGKVNPELQKIWDWQAANPGVSVKKMKK